MPGRTRCRPFTTIPVALAQAAADDAQALQLRSHLDGAVDGLVVAIQDQHELLAQVGADRFVLDQGGGVGLAADQLQAHVEARGELALGVVEHGAAADGAGTRVDLVVEEVQPAQVRVAVLAAQAEVHRALAARVATGLAGQLDVLEEHALVGVEVGVDLVGADQGGEQGLPGVDQVAGGDLGAADATVDRRGDPGEAQVQACRVQLRLGRGDRRLGFLGGGGAGVGEFRGDRVAGAQAFAALGFVDAPRLGRAGLLQLGFEALDLGLERARVDLEQQVAFLHQGAFMEGHAVDVARYPRAQLHRFRGFQAAGEFVPLVQRLFDDFGDADLGRRHALGGFRGLAAGAQDQYGRECEGVAPEEVG